MDNYDKIIQESLKQQRELEVLRKENNLKILDYLKEKINEFPTLRFCQLLEMLGLTSPNKFYEESVETYNKLIK